MNKINFLKPDKSNLNTFLYAGSFLFFISILDVFLKRSLQASGGSTHLCVDDCHKVCERS